MQQAIDGWQHCPHFHSRFFTDLESRMVMQLVCPADHMKGKMTPNARKRENTYSGSPKMTSLIQKTLMQLIKQLCKQSAKGS